MQATNPMNHDHLAAVRQYRAAYQEVCRALPWLDLAAWPDDPPAFPAFAQPSPCRQVKTAPLSQELKGRLERLQTAENILLLRYVKTAGVLEDLLKVLAPELAAQKLPVSVWHTDVTYDRLEQLAAANPRVNFIIESGPLKILYDIAPVESILKRCPNIFLCTYNFCNWLGLERYVGKGLTRKLLFGTHQPRYSPHVAMGAVALAYLPWEQKCDLAGNNLRRLLDLPVVTPPEVRFNPPAPFIIDAHAHNGACRRFPVADDDFTSLADWTAFMDGCALEQLYLCPMDPLFDRGKTSREYSRALREFCPARFRYFEMFHPGGGESQRGAIEQSLSDPACIGIKIHPSTHKVEADHDSYTEIYDLADRHGAVIMTHSWDVSPTNPVQYLSHPDRFRKHLSRHPRLKFVLGHAGGRPGSLPAVIQLGREFPEVRVDLAGDYYDNGVVECLADGLGADRIIFGSDLNWVDARINLALVLGARLPDDAVLKILRTNALATYAPLTHENVR